MSFLRCAVLLFFGIGWSSRLLADPRTSAIENAKVHLQQSTTELTSSLCFVVIGYEGNLPLFEAGFVPPPQNGTGFAVPVDTDGYFLTAAHSVLTDHDMYIMGSFHGRMKALKAEIVYRGDSSRADLDFAILKVGESIPRCFSFAPALPNDGETVYAVVRLGDQPVLAEGLCHSERVMIGETKGVAIASDIPVIGGDSGGPLLSQDLKLVGIASRGTRIWGFNRTYSCCPSQQFIRDLINHRKGNQPTPKA